MKKGFLHKGGFSLVEITVVLAIIGILAGIVGVSTSAARAKARDEKRLGDLREIQIGLALYHDVNRAYPPTGTPANDISDLNVLVTEKYLPSIPTDPTTGQVYEYMLTDQLTRNKYCLAAKLERTTPIDGSVSCQSSPAGDVSGIIYYKVQR